MVLEIKASNFQDIFPTHGIVGILSGVIPRHGLSLLLMRISTSAVSCTVYS